MQAALGANHTGSVEKRRQLRVHWVAERKKPPRQTARRLSSAKRSNKEVGLVEDHIVELKATAKANRRVQFGYGLNYLIDIENAVIVDVEATPARTYDEVAATKTMIDRAERCFDLKPKRLAADTAYGTGRFLGWLVKEKKITPHIPVWDMSKRDNGTFSRSDFTFDGRRDIYICPAGKTLTTSGRVNTDHGIRYFASVPACRAWPRKAKCCPNTPSRRIVRDVNEEARDEAAGR